MASGEKRQKPGAQAWGTRKNEKGKAASSSGGDRTGIREADRRSPKGQVGTPQIIARVQNKPWSAVRVARLLGVSHTWVNKLVKKFEADPEGMRRKMRAFAPANLEKLERAREETQRQRELGRLRGPIRWRRVKVKIQGRERKLPVPTREEMKKRKTLKEVASGEWLVASKQRQMIQSESPMRMAYREVPEVQPILNRSFHRCPPLRIQLFQPHFVSRLYKPIGRMYAYYKQKKLRAGMTRSLALGI